MKYLLIYNPTAGKGLSDHDLKHIKNEFISHGHALTIQETQYAGHISSLIKNLVDDKVPLDRVLVAGGDGTLREMCKALLEHDYQVPLGIVPSGTGNDFSRSLYGSNKLDRAIDIILKDTLVDVSVGVCDQQVFLNVVSTGFDAAIVKFREGIKAYVKGPFSYLLSTLAVLTSYRAKNYKIQTDSSYLEGDYLLVAIANGAYYGGGMKVAPSASVIEERLDVCIIKKMNKFKLLQLLPTIYSGKHVDTPYVDYFSCSSIHVKVEEENQVMNFDGDLKMHGDAFNCNIYTSKIKFIA